MNHDMEVKVSHVVDGDQSASCSAVEWGSGEFLGARTGEYHKLQSHFQANSLGYES